jgi:hypothetical protein
MRKLTYVAVGPILLVAVPIHAGDGRGFHGSRPASPHAVLVSSRVVVTPPAPVVVARPHAFVGPRVFAGVGGRAPFGWPAYAYPYPSHAYPPATEYAPSYVPPEPAYWYFCPDSRAYYPYVQQCPTAWLKVVPQPAP